MLSESEVCAIRLLSDEKQTCADILNVSRMTHLCHSMINCAVMQKGDRAR
jgi:hypothetical protein